MKSFPRFLQQSLYLLSFCASKAAAAAEYQHNWRAGGRVDGPATSLLPHSVAILCCGNFEGLGDSDREFTNNEPFVEPDVSSSVPGLLVGKFI